MSLRGTQISTPTARAQTPEPARRTWRRSACVAGTFCFLLGAVMLLGHFAGRDRDPWRSPQLLSAKEHLRQNPKDEPTKARIRQLDLQLRRRYFQQITRMSLGTLLLLTGAAVFLFSYGRGRYQVVPMPGLQPEPDAAGSSSAARRAVAAVGILAAAGLLAAATGGDSKIPNALAALEPATGPAGSKAGPAAAPGVPGAAELAVNWPRFLGWQAGFSASTNAPLKWDPATGEGVAWKVPAPVAGFNSPIVWDNKIFFSGGDAAKREVICLDAANGAVLWRQAIANVPGSPAQPPEIPESTGYAAASMATDGRRVYVIFANGDLAALSMDGKPVWSKGFGALHNAYGHSTSLATWKDRLIVQLDQGEAEENKSKLYAFDGATGKVAWDRPRQVGASWASPVVFEHAGRGQVVCLSLPHAIGYSAEDGAELWRAECLNGEVCPSPVYAGGMLFIASPSDRLLTIRPDGRGDVSKTHLAWSNDENVPDVTSPVSDGKRVFTLTTSGALTCLDAANGKALWTHELEAEFHASPVLAGDRLYLFSQNGRALVVQAGNEFKELLRVEMGDSFHASPALARDRLYVRGMTHVWCLSASPAKAPPGP